MSVRRHARSPWWQGSFVWGLVIAATFVGTVSVATPVQAAAIAVTTTADVIADDGVCSLREAIVSANADTSSGTAAGECPAGSGTDTIVLDATGTYTLTTQLPDIATPLTLDGNGNTIDADDTGSGLTVASGAIVTVHAVIITGGTSSLSGGGIYNDGGTLVVTDSTITGNGAHGIHTNGTFRLDHSAITGNSGPGIRSMGTLDVAHTAITGNTGGGIWSMGTLDVAHTAITGNTGVGIQADGTLHVEHSTITGNTAIGIISDSLAKTDIAASIVSDNGSYGIYDRYGRVNVTDSTISGNGGSGIATLGTLTVSGSTISGNTARDYGGGIDAYYAETTVTNSTISGNTAGEGGGGIMTGTLSSVTIAFSTITDNTAPAGAGIAAEADEDEVLTSWTSLEASIVAGNRGPGNDVDLRNGTGDSFTSGGFNVIGSVGANITAFAEDLTDRDPLLDPLGDRSGPTRTHALQPGSPAIDLVTDAVDDDQTADQRGIARPQGRFKDAGAYEANDTDGDGVVDVDDNCPFIANADQADADGDSIGDACDATPHPDAPLFSSIRTARLVDTRSAGDTVDDRFEGDGAIEGGSVFEVQIAERGGIPADASAAVLNLSTVDSAGNGFLTVYDCGARPLASAINYGAGRVVNNEIVTELSTTGTLCIFAKTTTHVVIDAAGYASASSPYLPITPARLVETRSGPGRDTVDGRFEGRGAIPAGKTYEVRIAGRGSVPDDAIAAVLSLTTVDSTAHGFLTIDDCGVRPLASAINFANGVVVNNQIIADLSSNGTICVFAKSTTHLVIDAVGAIPPGAGYEPISPVRLLETRSGPGRHTIDGRFAGDGPIVGGSQLEVQIAGRGGVPLGAVAAVMNLSTTGSTGDGYLTVHDCGVRPLASSLNYRADAVVNNEIIAELSPNGTVCIYAKTTTHLVIDVSGSLSPVD